MSTVRLPHIVLIVFAAIHLAPLHASADDYWRRSELAYCVYDVGSLPNSGYGSSAVAINNRNQIVGWSSTSEGIRSFIWDRRNGMRDLGVLSGNDSTLAYDINDQGTVVGASYQTVPPYGGSSFAWNQRKQLYALDIPFLDGSKHFATGINNRGQIVGGGGGSAAHPLIHAYLLDTDGDATDLGAFPGEGEMSSATEINDAGVVVGSSTLGFQSTAFIWTRNKGMRVLATLPDGWHAYSANDINNRGQVGGSLESAAGFDAYLWSRSEGLEAFGWAPYGGGGIFSINDAGQAVGSSGATGNPGAGGFIWDRHNGFRDLNDLRDPSSPLDTDVVIGYGYGINEAGWIAATGYSNEFARSHALVLVPMYLKSGDSKGGTAERDRHCPSDILRDQEER